MDKRPHVIRLGAESRHCAHPGCKDDIGESSVKFCAHHSIRRNRTQPGGTFLFKCAACPFEALLSTKKHTKVYCDDCAEERERERERIRARRDRERKAARGAANKAPANGIETGQATTAPAARDSAG